MAVLHRSTVYQYQTRQKNPFVTKELEMLQLEQVALIYNILARTMQNKCFVCFRGETRVRHYMIDQLRNKKFIIIGESKVHKTLKDLIEFHKNVSYTLDTIILTSFRLPLKGHKFGTNSHLLRDICRGKRAGAERQSKKEGKDQESIQSTTTIQSKLTFGGLNGKNGQPLLMF